MPPIPSSKEEKQTFMPICNQNEFFMESKKIKQSLALEEVSTIAEIPEEVEKSQKECKGVGYDKLEVLPSMEDNQHHGTFILHDFEDPFLHNKFAQDYSIQCFLD